MLDPRFPKWLLSADFQRTVEFIHYLFQDYSKREITEKTDRCVAISGLETRIARALGCRSRYGVFERYLQRNLFWLATDERFERFAYEEEQYVPSWSWVAYDGGIRFCDEDCLNKFEWAATIRFDDEDEHALIADVWGIRDGLRLDGEDVLDYIGVQRGWVRFDLKSKDKEECLCDERYVLIGKEIRSHLDNYHVMVVRPTRDGDYKRVGVGVFQGDYVAKESLSRRII